MIYQNRLCPFFNLNNCRWQVGMGSRVWLQCRRSYAVLLRLCINYAVSTSMPDETVDTRRPGPISPCLGVHASAFLCFKA